MKYFKNLSYIVEFAISSSYIDLIFILSSIFSGFKNATIILLYSFVFLELLLLFFLRKVLFCKISFSQVSVEISYGKKIVETIIYSDIKDVSRENIAKDWWIVLTTSNERRVKITSRKKIKDEILKHIEASLIHF